MLPTQPALDKVICQSINASLFLKETSRSDLSSSGTEDWIIPLLPILGQINLERMRFEPHYTTTRPEVFIYEVTRNESTTTSTDFKAHLTHEESILKAILQRIVITFDKAKEQIFEDGIESDFSRELVSFIKNYGNIAVRMLTDLIFNEEVNAEVASEALRWLGQMEAPETHSHRLWLLEQSLYCSSARVRDGAALGLAFLDDPHAIPDLREAIQRELYPELREDLEQVLEQLENSHR